MWGVKPWWGVQHFVPSRVRPRISQFTLSEYHLPWSAEHSISRLQCYRSTAKARASYLFPEYEQCFHHVPCWQLKNNLLNHNLVIVLSLSPKGLLKMELLSSLMTRSSYWTVSFMGKSTMLPLCPCSPLMKTLLIPWYNRWSHTVALTHSADLMSWQQETLKWEIPQDFPIRITCCW